MKAAFMVVYERLASMAENPKELCPVLWAEIQQLHAEFNPDKAWELLFANISWMLCKEVVTFAFLQEHFSTSDLEAHGFYGSGSVRIHDAKAVLFGSARAQISGHSRVLQFEQSQSTCRDSSFVSLFDDSRTSAKECIVEGFDDAQITGKGYAKIEAWDRVQVLHKKTDFLILREQAKASELT